MRRSFVCATLLALCTAACVQAITCDVQQKRDCGYVGITQAQCESKGCCWVPSNNDQQNGDPWCFYGLNTPSYVVSSLSSSSTGFSAKLTQSNPGAGSYGPALANLQLTATYETDTRVHFKLTDADNERFEIPQELLPYPQPGSRDYPNAGQPGSYDPASPKYVVAMAAQGQPLSLAVKRTSDGAVLFNLADLEYSPQFLQVSTILPSDSGEGAPFLYGLGEHVMHFKLPTDDHSFTMWNADVPTPWDQNIYGAHPFFMQTLSQSGNTHGIFMRSAAGMDVITSATKVQFRMIGGIMEWYVFLGPAPEAVVQQYQAVIGRPHLPPYWSFGFHQCKYGWKSLAEVQNVVATYAEHQIPLETIWADIDFMDQYEDFSWDPVNYPVDQVRAWTQKLNAAGQHYVPIVDPGIHNRSGSSAYESGLAQKVFITEADGSTPFIGQVWPGFTAFPDWFHPNTSKWWSGLISDFLDTVPYSGLWIDMNEVSSFINGGVTGDPKAPVNNPPYAINNFNSRAGLDVKTLPMDAMHGRGKYYEYDVHNLYGLAESIATKAALEGKQGTRSFIVSRSTFPGSGAHVAHWTGDNHATWDDLWRSIPGILGNNVMGIPMVGADICGFIGDTTEELCARWMALGSFSSFMRNHHEPGMNQEAYLWPSVEAVSKKTIGLRYTLLPTLYTLHANVHFNGGTVARSLMFNYPSDTQTYAIDSQFMWADVLLITPVLRQGDVSVWGYFPPASIWYSAWNLTKLQGSGWLELPCSIQDAIQVHIAGGSILPTQGAAMTTAQGRQTPFGLLVGLDQQSSASGSLFWDSGADLVDGSNALQVAFKATAQGVSWHVVSNTFKGSMPPLQTVTIGGFQYNPSAVSVDGQALPAGSWSFSAANQVLSVSLNHPLTADGTIAFTQSYESFAALE